MVKVRNFLTEGGFEIGASKIASQMVGDIGKKGRVDVCSRESDNANVDKVEPANV